MAQNHVCKGEVIEYTLVSGSTITAGTVFANNDFVCVALVDIAEGETGNAAVSEVWALPKEAEAIDQGKKVYLNSSGNITATSTDNTYAGKTYAAAGSSDATVEVKINV